MHYLWCGSQHHKLDPSKPAPLATASRAVPDAACLPVLRFHDLRHMVVTRLLDAGEPHHVVESITGRPWRSGCFSISCSRLRAVSIADGL
jgi:hypothetical protein